MTNNKPIDPKGVPSQPTTSDDKSNVFTIQQRVQRYSRMSNDDTAIDAVVNQVNDLLKGVDIDQATMSYQRSCGG